MLREEKITWLLMRHLHHISTEPKDPLVPRNSKLRQYQCALFTIYQSLLNDDIWVGLREKHNCVTNKRSVTAVTHLRHALTPREGGGGANGSVVCLRVGCWPHGTCFPLLLPVSNKEIKTTSCKTVRPTAAQKSGNVTKWRPGGRIDDAFHFCFTVKSSAVKMMLPISA